MVIGGAPPRARGAAGGAGGTPRLGARGDPPLPVAERLLEVGLAGDHVLEVAVEDGRHQEVGPEPAAAGAEFGHGQSPGEEGLHGAGGEGEQQGEHADRHRPVQVRGAAGLPDGVEQDREDLEGEPRLDLAPAQKDQQTELLTYRQCG
ncbi:hypothetical protein SAZ_31815 [Streptomyces noursei ZPM]|nr:hypothetical protein SAZ_31815 [Streptomyces noursei ZPM]